jgi:hypothetical protein
MRAYLGLIVESAKRLVVSLNSIGELGTWWIGSSAKYLGARACHLTGCRQSKEDYRHRT